MKYFNGNHLRKAFTIVELMVVVGIFGLIMSVALANQAELNNDLLITNLAYEIGLIARETQAYGIGVRAQSGIDSPQGFQGGFGMNISLDPDTQTTDKIIVFKDNDGDSKYSDPTELFSLHEFRNQRGNRIHGLCIEHPHGTVCNRANLSGTSADEINIVFKRPNPEALFSAIMQGDTGVIPKSGPAYIVINTAAGRNCRAIIIEVTGQIRVESGTSASPACSNI